MLGPRLALIAAVSAWTSGCVPKSSSSAEVGTGSPGTGSAAGAEALPAGGNLLGNSDFEGERTVPWTSSFTAPASGELAPKSGAACLRIDEPGVNKWDAQIRHRQLVIQKGHHYTVRFRIWADRATRASIKVGMSGPPYTEYWNRVVDVGQAPITTGGEFTMYAADDATAELALHLGGNLAQGPSFPVTVCIDDAYLIDPAFAPLPQEAEVSLPKVRVNQLGYFPHGPKWAVVADLGEAPLDWHLKQQGRLLAYGKTKVLGPDADSGEVLQLIDFSKVTSSARGLVLSVSTPAGADSARTEESSYPFDIDAGVYAWLEVDALKYFYHNRSGVAITLPHAGEERWTRPAGHVASDRATPCAKDAGCNYTLDVSKGWYDAGDHGKYVVNGGIAVWTLLNAYERAAAFGNVRAFGDGQLGIPESKNGVPDLLDEVRWELEFLLGMQVPPGQPHAGMAHHKMHDVEWTGLGMAPHEAEAKVKRHLRPVSTAATLNLAAAAAQAARVFAPFDAKFSARCLRAARAAYAAARQEPRLFAPASDRSGGGPYDDQNVSDEFFWAAAELFVTTGEQEYQADLMGSEHFRGPGFRLMSWQETEALGVISLGLPSKLPSRTAKKGLAPAERKRQQDRIVAAADHLLAALAAQGYRVPYDSGPKREYPWGSNSVVLNGAVVLGHAYDFTKRAEYLGAAIQSLDYILGRNPLAQSYVTGYGERPLRHPHHRFWSEQASPAYPEPPPGALSGGPNSHLQDPYVRGAGLSGCAPMKCFVDHIEAYSANEVAINWNAPLAWVAAFLNDAAN